MSSTDASALVDSDEDEHSVAAFSPKNMRTISVAEGGSKRGGSSKQSGASNLSLGNSRRLMRGNQRSVRRCDYHTSQDDDQDRNIQAHENSKEVLHTGKAIRKHPHDTKVKREDTGMQQTALRAVASRTRSAASKVKETAIQDPVGRRKRTRSTFETLSTSDKLPSSNKGTRDGGSRKGTNKRVVQGGDKRTVSNATSAADDSDNGLHDVLILPHARSARCQGGRLRKLSARRGSRSPSTSVSDAPYDHEEGDADNEGRKNMSFSRTNKGKGKRLVRSRDDRSPDTERRQQTRNGARSAPARGKQNTRGSAAALTAASTTTPSPFSRDDEFSLLDSGISESVSNGESDDEPVNCRCGDTHWKDGRQWIKCDARGCWTWEHLECAYPGGGEIPDVHLCRGCRGKGSTSVRSLIRGADEMPPQGVPSSHGSRGGFHELSYEGKQSVRRSRRVAVQREAKPILRRKNVVGTTSESPSSSDGSHVEVIVGPAKHATSGGNSANGGDGSDSDEFFAPEGRVESMKEFRCHCGALQEHEGIGGAIDVGPAGVDSRERLNGLWVQCHSDFCGVWQHAVCCDFGCARKLGDASHAERHWCRTCDPKGKKHAKYQEKMQKKVNSRKPNARARRRSVSQKLLERDAQAHENPDEAFSMQRFHLWRAVAAGDSDKVKQVLNETSKDANSSLERLFDQGAYIQGPRGLGMHETAQSNDQIEEDQKAPDSGVTLLMLASGLWAVLHDPSATDVQEDSKPGKRTSCGGVLLGLQPIEGRPSERALEVEQVIRTDETSEAIEVERPDAVGGNGGGDAIETTTAGDNRRSQGAGKGTRDAVDSRCLGSGARLDILRAVLECCGQEQILKTDGTGRTAIHHAAATGADREILLLLEGDPERRALQTRDHKGMTPLLLAASGGHAGAIGAMLGALPVDMRDAALAATDASSGENALHLACLDGHVQFVELILSEEKKSNSGSRIETHSAKLGKTKRASSPLVLARTSHGMTPLMAAAGCPSPECVRLVLEELSRCSFKSVGERLAELRAGDASGMNALHWAAGRDASGSVSAAGILLDAERTLLRHCRPSLEGRSGSSGWDAKAMINCGDSQNGASPLHLAAAVSHKEMVSLLLKEGANSVLLDNRGWTPVMYADFDGRKEGAILELLQYEPERQLGALGSILTSPDGRNNPRVVDVVKNLATVPAFFSLVNGFVRQNPGLLLTTLSFLRDEPRLLDFDNKRNLLRSILACPDFVTRAALDAAARVPASGFGFDPERIIITREAGEALGALMRWMAAGARRWGKSGLAAWLRIYEPSFAFYGEAGYGPGVDREAWEAIAEDLVRPFPQHVPASNSMGRVATVKGTSTGAPNASDSDPSGSIDSGESGWPWSPQKIDEAKEAFFIPVVGGMSSYCPRGVQPFRANGDQSVETSEKVRGTDRRRKVDQEPNALDDFELLGLVLGATLKWNKVLNLNLNAVVWKAILSRKVRIVDLELVDETYYRSLKQVLDMEGAEHLGLSFGSLSLEFCQNGSEVDPNEDVTDRNKDRYAFLALESRTFGRWHPQCSAIADGLKRLVPLVLLRMFTENELGLLLAGPGDIDPHDWERHAVFSGAFPETLKTWFWSVVRTLAKEERSLLLQFATGCSRLPAGGFAALPRPFTVAILDYDPLRPLPMAATCFYMLKLPRYPDSFSLKKNLLIAIRHGASGFEFC